MPMKSMRCWADHMTRSVPHCTTSCMRWPERFMGSCVPQYNTVEEADLDAALAGLDDDVGIDESAAVSPVTNLIISSLATSDSCYHISKVYVRLCSILFPPSCRLVCRPGRVPLLTTCPDLTCCQVSYCLHIITLLTAYCRYHCHSFCSCLNSNTCRCRRIPSSSACSCWGRRSVVGCIITQKLLSRVYVARRRQRGRRRRRPSGLRRLSLSALL
jgi:hypothetical protein